jgi:hypothetical protein
MSASAMAATGTTECIELEIIVLLNVTLYDLVKSHQGY